MGVFVVVNVGGVESEPLTNPPPPPGSVLADLQASRGAVSKEEYLRLLRMQLEKLVSLGVFEAFLVRALRDELARYFTTMAETGEADERRAAWREAAREVSRDPGRIERYRQSLARRNPEAAKWSDDQVADRLRKMADSPILDPTTADAALDRWAEKRHFDTRADQLLSDSDIEEWARAASRWA